MNLGTDISVTQGVDITDGAAGSTDLNGIGVDTQGYEGVLVITQLGTLTSTCVGSIKLQMADDSAFSVNLNDVAGSGYTIVQASDGNKSVIHDLFRPRQRYVRAVVKRATANIVVAGQHVVLYGGPKKKPATQGLNHSAATAITLKQLVSAAAGTP